MKREEVKTILPDITDDQLNQLMKLHGADIEGQKTTVTQLQNQLKTAQEGLKAFDGVDVEDLKGQIAKLTTDLAAQADGFAFDSALDGAIRDAGGRSLKAVRGMLDLDALRASKDRGTDIKAALDGLVKENPWAFAAAQTSPAATVSTGSEHGEGGIAKTDGVEADFLKLNPGIKL